MPRLVFTRVSDGDVRVFDYGAPPAGVPSVAPISVDASSSWTEECPDALQIPGETSNFCSGGPGLDPMTLFDFTGTYDQFMQRTPATDGDGDGVPDGVDLCRVMGSPEWSRETRFSTMDSRRTNSETLDELLGQWTTGYEAHEVMRVLQEAGVPAGAVQNQSDLWEDPQLKHQGFFQWLDHTECGPMPYDGLQFLLSKTPGKLRMPHALVGEHNELILKEWLKLSDDEIADLIVAEALEVS